MAEKTNTPAANQEGQEHKPKVRKITDRQFLDILRQNGGLYSRTARAITQKYGLHYTRQAVQSRAKKFPMEEVDIKEENLDVAEETIIDIMRGKDKRLALKAAEDYLKAQGKLRGYGDSLDLTSGNKPIEPFCGVLPIYKPQKEEEKGG